MPTTAWAKLARGLMPPLAVFAIVRIVFIISADSYGVNALQPRAWIQWDGQHYLSIARDGYTLARHPPNGKWYGSTGWFPLYPWTVRGVVYVAHLKWDVAMVLVPAVFHALTLLFLWNRWILPDHDRHKWILLLCAGFFPGAVYQLAAFPISMTTFFIALHLHSLWRARWIIAGLCGALAAMCHPIGCPLAAVPVLFALITRANLARASVASLLCLLGGFAVMLTDRLTVGRWDAYFLVQSGFFAPRLANPVTTIWFHLKMLGESYRFQPPSHQLLLVVAVVISMLMVMWRSKARNNRDRLLGIFATIYLLFPLFAPVHSEHREHATLLPAVMLTAYLPMRTRVIFLLLTVAVAYELAHRYLIGHLT